jgi:hypothetical protein
MLKGILLGASTSLFSMNPVSVDIIKRGVLHSSLAKKLEPYFD